MILTSFTNSEAIKLSIIIICIFLSAFFSMSETVVSSVSEVKVKTAVEERKSGSKKALNLIENYDRTLTTLLVGNNIVNTLMSILSVALFAAFIKNKNYVDLTATAVMTVTLLIFGEIMPKTLGKKYCETIIYKIAAIVNIISILLFPIVIIFRGIQKLFTGKEVKVEVSENELENILDTMEEDGSIEATEVELIKNVFDLNDRTVEDIMIHRMDVTAFDVDTPLSEIKDILLESMYSRIPVFEGDKDHIVGILNERDFLNLLVKNRPIKVKDIMRPVTFVSKTMKVGDLIKFLQKEQTHLAVVLGEYGDTLGIVTMEDALEELVGEIYDEHDEITAPADTVMMLEDGCYLVDGEIFVDDLFEKLEIGQAPEDTHQKLSSWLFEQGEELPEIGMKHTIVDNFTKLNEETQEYEDYSKDIIFEIDEVEEKRISRVKITIVDHVEQQDEE